MLIPLKLVRDQPLQQQLYDQLQALIASARLQPGARMPSTRMMAEQFAISRITVLLTYERLIAEGYLQTLPAKGTFVARGPNGCRGVARRQWVRHRRRADSAVDRRRPDQRIGWEHETASLARAPSCRRGRPATAPVPMASPPEHGSGGPIRRCFPSPAGARCCAARWIASAQDCRRNTRPAARGCATPSPDGCPPRAGWRWRRTR